MNKFRSMTYTSLSKRLLMSLLTIGMATHLTGCAMGGSSEESTAAGEETFAEESSGDFAEGEDGAKHSADGEVADAEGAMDEAAADGEVAASEPTPAEGDDLALEEETKSAATDVAANDSENLDDELSLDDEQGLPSDIASNDKPADSAPILDEPPAAAPTDAPVFEEAASDPTPAPSDAVAAAPSEPGAWVPVKKMKTAAFMAGNTNLNRVYVARAGETRPQIAQKIYGDKARSKDLLKWNGFLSRGVKTGDKIYYSSPTNPTDGNMMTYYEDVGIPAQNYVSRDGDNIREVAKTLLGSNDSWKEVWSTNPDVESKGNIPAGLNIRYWPEGSAGAAAPTLAHNETPPAEPAPVQDPLAHQAPPPAPSQDPLAAPPADPLAPNDPVAMQPPQPPAQDPMHAPTGTPASVPPVVGSTDPMNQPPSQPPAVVAPVQKPAHAPKATADNEGKPEGAAGTEEADNMMMMGLAGIVILAAGAVAFLMRRSRSRKVDLTQTTQVG